MSRERLQLHKLPHLRIAKAAHGDPAAYSYNKAGPTCARPANLNEKCMHLCFVTPNTTCQVRSNVRCYASLNRSPGRCSATYMTASPKKELAIANQNRVYVVGSVYQNDSCISPVPPLDSTSAASVARASASAASSAGVGEEEFDHWRVRRRIDRESGQTCPSPALPDASSDPIPPRCPGARFVSP